MADNQSKTKLKVQEALLAREDLQAQQALVVLAALAAHSPRIFNDLVPATVVNSATNVLRGMHDTVEGPTT